jgi:hypothetical protein
MPSIAYRRCRRIVDLLLENGHLPEDVVKWDEIKQIIELEIVDDPRTVALYRNRLKRWGFLTEIRRTLFQINLLDRYGDPVTKQKRLESEKDVVERALGNDAQR